MKLRLAILCALCVLCSAAPAGAEVLVRGKTIDGPDAAIQRMGGFDVARDGSGAVVYTKQVGGVDHVFSSRLVGGIWSAPEQLDQGLEGASSEPAVTVGDGGLVLVAFVNAGRLITTSRASGTSPWTAPSALSPDPVGAGPSLDLSIHSKGYLTFSTTAGGNSDVRVARYRDGAWTLLAAPLDAQPSADAGSGPGRPRLVSAASGVAVVAWGERGNVYARRVRDTQPSASVSQMNPSSLGDRPSLGADSPEVASPFDDSMAEIAFRQDFADADGRATSRVLVRALRGTLLDAPMVADGSPSAGDDGAARPRLVADGRGFGLLASTRASSHEVFAQLLRRPVPAMRLDTDASTTPAFPVAALAGSAQGLVAWQHEDGTSPAQILGRRATLVGNGELAGSSFAPEQTLSDPLGGPAQAGLGLEAASDRLGDLLVGFVQGRADAADARRISLSYYDVPPAGFAGTFTQSFQPRALPLLTWRPARDLLDAVRYEVSLDGAAPFSVGSPQTRPQTVLADGVHTLDVTAVDSQGQRTVAPRRLVKVDKGLPRARVGIRGLRRARRSLRFLVAAYDPPPRQGVPASGVARILVDFGDDSPRRAIRHDTLHAYAFAGNYRVIVTVVDRAGNVTRYRPTVRIPRSR